MAQEQLPKAAPQFHLVGKPQGPLGAERVRGRIPGPGQHRRLRSQRPAADGRLSGAGRRHGLDGPVLPEHARDRRRAGRRPIRTTSTWRSSSSSTSCGSPRRWRMWAGAPACGMKRTASSMTCCACPTARPSGSRCGRWSGCLPLCAATTFDGALLKAHTRKCGNACKPSSGAARKSLPSIHAPGKPGVAGRHLASILDETKLRRVLAKMLDENEFLSPYGIRSLSRFHAEHPYRLQRRRPGVSRRLSAGRIRHGHVRRQLQLARADLDAGQRPDHPGLAAILHLLSATISKWNARPAPAA